MKAYELLDSPEKWTQRVYCRDNKGNEFVHTASVMYPEAVCWCLEGAVRKCYGWLPDEVRDKIRTKLKMAPFTWNDAPERTWEEVHALLKELDI